MAASTTEATTTADSTTEATTTQASTTEATTTQASTTEASTTAGSTTQASTMQASTTEATTTQVKVAGTMEVEMDVQDDVTQELLEETFKKGIANVLNISVEHVVKLIVSEIGQNSGSRRLQSVRTKKYEVSYEVIPPSSMDPQALTNKASRITDASTSESQVFRQILLSQDGVSQISQVVPKIAAYIFEEEIPTIVPGTEPESSGMSAGIVVLIILLVILFVMLAIASAFWIRRRMAWRSDMNIRAVQYKQRDVETGADTTIVREPSHTLLDGNAREPVKKNSEVENIENSVCDEYREACDALGLSVSQWRVAKKTASDGKPTARSPKAGNGSGSDSNHLLDAAEDFSV